MSLTCSTRKRISARKTWVACLCTVFLLSTMNCLALADFKKNAAGEFEDINKAFRSATHWKGADGAMTVDMGSGKTLWLFGDTWIIDSKPARSLPSRRMISNSVATQEYIPCEAKHTYPSESVKSSDTLDIGVFRWNFWFGGTPAEPTSIFNSKEKGTYYWPGCGITHGDKLYLILKKIRKKDDPNPLFQFDWFAEDLLIVQNPHAAPSAWDYTISPVSTERHEVQYGLACAKDAIYFYSLCYLEESGNSTKKTILARNSLSNLSNKHYKDWEYWCYSEKSPEGLWVADFHKAKNIIPDGGPEMSLFFHNGLDCFVSVYQPPLSPVVNLRVSRRIEGPWSDALAIFKIPEIKLADGKTSALVYAGKASDCLSSTNEIGFTYCANPGGLEQHLANPDVYFPTARSYPISKETLQKLLETAEKRKPEH